MATGRSRYNKHSIMANSGFGDLVIKKNGVTIIVPQSLITRDGSVYKRIQDLISSNDFDKVKSHGVEVKKG